jgi:branched-subunit amino acid transport protein AzlD
MDSLYVVAAIAVMALATVATRALPFLLFRNREPPAFVPFLAKYAPPAILTILTLYCLKGVDWLSAPYGLRELAAVGFTAILHLWRRNTLLSIAGGTVLYMILIRLF